MADGSRQIDSEAAVPTALYRHYDADGGLLYVGISLSPTYRLSQHRVTSPWFRDIASIKVQWLASRREALEAERDAIQNEKPEHNTIHRVLEAPGHEDEPLSPADVSRVELVREFARFRSAYTVKGAAEAVGIRESSMRLALLHGDLRYYDAGHARIIISGWSLIEYMEALEAGTVAVRRLERMPDGTSAKVPSLSEIIGAS